jgi:hypothetical protein
MESYSLTSAAEESLYARNGLISFVNQDFLSDFTLTSQAKSFKVHKVVLASASLFFYNKFRSAEVQDSLELPEPIPAKFQSIFRPYDMFETVLKYIYSNQDSKILTYELLNKNVAFQIFSIAHILQINSLVDLVGEFIAQNLLEDTNGPEILYEGIKYSSETLCKASEESIVRNFESLIRNMQSLEGLMNIPLEYIIQIVKCDELNVANESLVYGFVCSYLQKRENLPVIEDGKVADDGSKPQLTPHEIAKKRLEIKRFTEEEKLSLLVCVRYPFLSHNELLQAACNSLVSVAKDLILEGLSVQLSALDKSKSPQAYSYRVVQTPRKSYQASPEIPDNNSVSSNKLQTQLTPTSTKRDILEEKREEVWNLRHSLNSEMFRGSNQYLPDRFTSTYSGSPLRHGSPKPPQRNTHWNEAILPIDFIYDYDFDDNGVLFYLGSYAKTRPWQNPHILGKAQAFASSVGFGKIEDFLTRTANNLRTGNEPNSYLGVDIGNRYILPSAYSLRNRHSKSHVCFNWQLEGSRDQVNWQILDRRVHYTGDDSYDYNFETDRNALKTPGATSTWGIDPEALDPEGYRFFRIVQIDKNSSGSYNLALSNIEIYGKAIRGKWA